MASIESEFDIRARKAKGTAHLDERRAKIRSGELVPTKTVSQLSPKQKAFIKYVSEGDSGSAAAIRAGCTPTSAKSIASQWRALPVVQEQIEIARKQYEEASMMTKKKVIDMHMEAFEMAKLMSEPASMVSAVREIGKLCGYYEPKKVDVNVNVNGSIAIERMNKMSDADLLKIIEDAAQMAADDENDETPLLGIE